MRPVRVGEALYTIGSLHCLWCGRTEADCDAYGVVAMTCVTKWCKRRWMAARLPPGATGQQIVTLYGWDVARALCGALRPGDDPCSDDALAVFPLPIPSDRSTYLQYMPDAIGGTSVSWYRATFILRTLMPFK